MPEQSLLTITHALFVADIYHFHVVGVDVDGLVTDYQLSEARLFIVQDEKVRISYLKLVLPLQQEGVRLNSVLVEFDQENAQLLVKLIAKHVKVVVFGVEDDLFNGKHVELVIEINLHFLLEVVVNAICETGDHHRILFYVHTEELWLLGKRLFESVQGCNLSGVKVELENAVIFRKDDGVFLGLALGIILEIKLSAHLLEESYVYQLHNFMQIIYGSLTFFLLGFLGITAFEDEQLVVLLIVHHQVFARNDSHVLFVVRLLHANDLVWLPRLRWQQLNWQLLNLLVRLGIVHYNFVHLRHQERVNGLQFKAFGPLAVLFDDRHQKVMLVLTHVNLKRVAQEFVADSKLDFAPEKHHAAVHEVKHHVVKDRLEGVRVNFEEVNVLISYHLDANIAFCERNLPS